MTADGMVIRRAGADEMLTLWGYSPDTAPATSVYFMKNISEGNAVFWTVEKDGDLIGELYAFFDIEEDRDFADGKGTAYLCAFRIKREYRGQGIGTLLMNTVLSELGAMGIRRVTIGVDEERNERLNRRLGFDRLVKHCHYDPCDRDAGMKPVYDEKGFKLLSKELQPDLS